MEVFVLHILKLNIIAAVVILLVKVLAALLKGKVSARWKYVNWLIVAVSLTTKAPSEEMLQEFEDVKANRL